MSDAICASPDCSRVVVARGLCKPCYGVLYRSGVIAPQDRTAQHRLTAVDKAARTAFCSKCGPVHVKLRSKDGSAECRIRIAQRAGTTGRREQARPQWRKWLRKKYGIDLDDWHALLVAQSGRCAICERALVEPCVDHDHDTGEVRGLLCHPCNRGIGLLGDSPRHLAAALRYLAA